MRFFFAAAYIRDNNKKIQADERSNLMTKQKLYAEILRAMEAAKQKFLSTFKDGRVSVLLDKMIFEANGKSLIMKFAYNARKGKVEITY